MAKVISKTLANEVAIKMCKDVDKKIKEEKSSMSSFFKSAYYSEVLGSGSVNILDGVDQRFIKKIKLFSC